MAVDGSVVFEVDANVSDAERELARLHKDIVKLEADMRVKSNEKGALAARLEAAKKEYTELQHKLKEFNRLSGSEFEASPEVQKIGERLQELDGYIAKTQSEIEKTGEAIEKANIRLEATKMAYGEILQEADRLRQKEEQHQETVENPYADEETMSKIEILKKRIQSLAALLASLPQRGMDALKKDASDAEKAVDGVKKKSKSSHTEVNKLIKTLKDGLVKTAKQLNVFSNLTASIQPKLKRLGGMIRRVFVFSVITSGLRAVRTQISKYLSVNTEFSTALGQLKGVLLTAFQPIYDAAIPALTTLINVLTRAIAAFSQFTATLFGTTANQAQKNAKALYDQASATEQAGDAADEASKSMAGFDEINKLQDSSSSSAGSSSTEAAPLFDYEYDTSVFDSWGEAFSALLDNMIGGVQKLKGTFDSFAAWLNGLSINLLDMFKFPGVEEKVTTLAKELADAFNGLVNGINWNELGQAIGAGIGLALLGAVTFLYGFDWLAFGWSIAEFINGAVSQINWEAMGQLLWAGYKLAIETLAGLLLNLDMKQLAEAASKVVIGFFDSMTETLASIDWEKIGHQVMLFLVSVDWASVADSVFTAIGAAFGAATAFLWGLIKDAWKEVVDWWFDVAYEDGEFTLKGLLQGIIDVVAGIGKWIKEHIFDPFIEGFKKVFGIHSPSTVMAEMGNFLMEGLFNGINEKIGAVADLFKSIFEGFLKFLNGVFTGDWKKAWEGISSVFKNIWNGIISVLESAVNFIIDGINFLISKLNTIRIEIPDWVPGVGGETFGISIPSVSKVSIPRLAQGAVIPPNREFMAVLGDQKRGNNIEAPEDLIRQIVREEAGGNSQMLSLLQAILTAIKAGQTMEVDRRAFGKIVRDAYDTESQRVGVSFAGV